MHRLHVVGNFLGASAFAILFAGLGACGGSSGGSITSSTGSGGSPAPNLSGSVTGQNRVVTNQIYSYSAAASDTTPASYSWAWGDGTTDAASASAATRTKVWRGAGNYTASLTLTSTSGGTTTADQAVSVVDHPISSGAQHSCAILSDNTVACWGQNNAGQLGDGTTFGGNSGFLPKVVPGLNNVISLAARGYGTCAAKIDGTVWCWGSYGFTSSPSQVTAITNAVALSATAEHVCALQRAGTVKCFGGSNFGALGDGTLFHGWSDVVQVANLTDAISIAAGYGNTCAIKANQTVVCWGYGLAGTNGGSSTANSAAPIAVAGVTNANSLVVGESLACAVLVNGTVTCWGNAGSSLSATYSRAQAISSTTVTSGTPTTLSGINNVASLTLGRYHACALKTDHTVECWGTNSYDGVVHSTPFAVIDTNAQALKNVQAISAGWDHTCALKFSGVVYCWGSNSYGQLGDGLKVNSPIAQPVVMSAFGSNPAPLGSIAVTSGSFFACSLKVNGTVACWGIDYSGEVGQLGNGTNDASFNTAGLVKNQTGTNSLTGVSFIDAGAKHACAVVSGKVVCWGDNSFGQLGNGTTVSSNLPVEALNLNSVESVSAGDYHTCALKTDATVVCWGDGRYGSIGGNVSSSVPIAVAGIAGVKSLATGAAHTCALKITGTVYCWGYDFVGFDSTAPVQKAGLSNIAEITVGTYAGSTCAVKDTGTVFCWGSGGNGQLSAGAVWTNSGTPVQMNNLGNVSIASAGALHSCTLRVGGAVACWGSNGSGQLGDGTYSSTAYPSGLPSEVVGINSAITIAAGADHNCALKLDESIWCWGGNYGPIPTQINDLNSSATTSLSFWK
jgi:alpha-tubulin suppressor-like RCC1 family protein